MFVAGSRTLEKRQVSPLGSGVALPAATPAAVIDREARDLVFFCRLHCMNVTVARKTGRVAFSPLLPMHSSAEERLGGAGIFIRRALVAEEDAVSRVSQLMLLFC
jgi:hypothetical protein